MGRRTRNRQLARLAARRQAERLRRQRRRRVTAIVASLVVAAVGLALIVSAFGGIGDDGTVATPTPTPAETPTPDAEPGTRTGTVDPERGPRTVACGAEAPRRALRPKPQFAAPAEVLEEDVAYTATIETSCGDIVVELLADRAPETVNSFVFLARERFFDGTRFHRLDGSIDVIQGGDPTGTGTGGPGYTIPGELQGGETYGAGVLAMANSGSPDSGGSQFFIITGPDGHGLDANAAYTIFGEVVDGLDVARRLQDLRVVDPQAAATGDISAQRPAEAVYIERVTISTEPA